MALSDELIAIKLELKGQREAISGLHSVDKAQKGIGTSTAAAGTAAEKAEKKTSRLSRAYASLGKTAKWGLGFLGVGGVFAFKSAIDHTEELSKTTTGLARNFGFSVQQGSRWAALANARGIDSKALSTTFSVLSSKMVDAARKGGTALTPWHQLGVTQMELSEHSDNAGWALMRVTKALGEEEGGAKRSAAAKGVLGKGWLTLAPLMSEGVKGLQKQLHWADKYGDVLNGKTNDAIMKSVTAQRESKEAIGGLQTSMTLALLPAIDASNRELQKFTQTLNSDKLTDDQKFHRIEQQFLGIENTLIDIVTAALPKIAEHGGELGVKLAGAVWHGFQESDAMGKFVIAGWLFMAMGGGGLIREVGGRAGGKLATALGTRFLTTVAPFFAAEGAASSLGGVFASKVPGLKGRFRAWGGLLGRAFGLGVVTLGTIAIAEWLRELTDTKTTSQFWHNSPFGVDNVTEDEGGAAFGGSPFSVHTPLDDALGFHKQKAGHVKLSPHLKNHDHRLPRASFPGGHSGKPPSLPRIAYGAWGQGGRPNPRPIVLQVDGKVLAEITASQVAAAEALG